MNICVISNLYPPLARGGAEIVAARVVHELCRRGHRVVVISTRPFDGPASCVTPTVERATETVYRFFPLNVYHTLSDHRHAFPVRCLWHLVDLWSPVSAKVVGSILDREKPDVVLTHNLKGIGLAIPREIRKRGIRHVHTIHDVQLSIPSGLLLYGQEETWTNRSFLRTGYEAATQKAIGSPDVVVSPSHYLADFYRSRGFFSKSLMEIVPNPSPDVQAPTVDRRPAGPLRLLFAGQLEAHKGIVFLLETIAKLSIPVELHIAGEGSLAAFVSDWADRNRTVTYHGFVSLENLLKLLVLCDAVVVPSLCYENSPTILYESFLTGIPVLASAIGGIGELVRRGENGLLFTPGDAKELASTIQTFASELPAWREKHASIQRGIMPYRLSVYVDTLERLMNTVFSRRFS